MTGPSADESSTGLDILFVYRRGRDERIVRHRVGEGPDEMLYGLNYLTSLERVDRFIEGSNERWNWRRYLTFPFEVQIARLLRMGFAVDIAWQHLSRLRKADVIVSTVDACGLPIAMLKYVGLLNTPMVYISQGLSDRFSCPHRDSLVRRFFKRAYSRFLASAERVVVLGEGAVDPVCEQFELPAVRVSSVPFGIDAEFWTPAANPRSGDYVLSVGSDLARDYATLLTAIGNEPLRLVTRLPVQPPSHSAPVEVSTNHSDLELRELYRRARFVVTPLRNVAQPSGQSATLQAMACGKAVILTRTLGLWEPEQMRHLDNCYLVEPYDVDQLRLAIRYLADHPREAERIGAAARRTVEERYNSRYFAAQLEEQIRRSLKAA